jgi:aspartate carbamoyltransferase catalytic subunit
MPHPSASLIEIPNLTFPQIDSLFLSALEYSKSSVPKYLATTTALLFFEPSTRTRFSFEAAAARLGSHPLVFEGVQGTSLEKGESIEDTVLNIAAMEPEALIIRCADDVDLNALQSKVSMPIVNAGWGMKGHPSQALLDALTMKAHGRDFAKEKLLVVGDVKHSRVMSSHFQLSQILGYEIAVCGPQEFLPTNYQGRHFAKLADGLAWATSIMALRLQHERHGKKYPSDTYHQEYGLNLEKLKSWKSEGLVMHPGPINYGVELSPDVNQDSRSCILEQVRWGVYLRQALLARIFAGGKGR